MYDAPTEEIDRDMWENLTLVLTQEHEDIQLLKLHLFTEYMLNRAIMLCLRTNPAGLKSLRLGYAQKVKLLEVARILDKNCCDLLRALNRVRQKLAHELAFALTAEDRSALLKFVAKDLPQVHEQNVLLRLAPFLGGYLSGGVTLSKIIAERIATIRPSDVTGRLR